MNKVLINKYFNAWNNKDILQLKNLVSVNIHLKDWDNEVFGVTEFLSLNEKRDLPQTRGPAQTCWPAQCTRFCFSRFHVSMFQCSTWLPFTLM